VGTTAEKVLGTIGGSLWEPWQRSGLVLVHGVSPVGTTGEKGVVTSGKIT